VLFIRPLGDVIILLKQLRPTCTYLLYVNVEVFIYKNVPRVGIINALAYYSNAIYDLYVPSSLRFYTCSTRIAVLEIIRRCSNTEANQTLTTILLRDLIKYLQARLFTRPNDEFVVFNTPNTAISSVSYQKKIYIYHERPCYL